jgi:hypothetical protein
MKRFVCAGMVLLGAWVTALPASATSTRYFRQSTVKDFEEGEATSTMVAPPGQVVPGMKTERVAIDAAFAWCAALSRDGTTAYFGTGDRGRIFALPIAGNAPAKKLVEIDAPWVTSLATRADGRLLAGSTPGGRIFLVDAKTGKSTLFAKLAADHVWAMAYDVKRAVTYAATGNLGLVFAIDAMGGAKPLWDSGDKHVMSLAMDGDTLLAGTADKAILYRVHLDGRAEALHDFEADEIRAIVRTKGAIYLAVNDFDNPADANPPPTTGAQPAKGTRIVASPAPASGAIPRADAVKAHGGVYRLNDDGRIEQLFALADGYFTSLVLDGSGNLFAASGSQGKLYRIAPDRSVALAADVTERQALSLLPAEDGFLVGSGDVGAIYRVRPAKGSAATYLSKVFDAETPARWGRVWWTGSPNLTLETRSGNTGKPDSSWSAYRRIDGVAHHDGQSSGAIRSPGARYLQYRATLPVRDSVLRDISLYYLPHNQRARVTEVYLGDAPAATPPAASGAATATTTSGSSRSHTSTLKLRWKVENPDGDELIHKLWFRRVGDSVWRPLGGPEPLTKAEYDWNTDSVPDGRYVIRVWTSDEKVTPAGRALDQTFESPAMLVDNTKPEVFHLSIQGATVRGRARDAASVISTIEFAVDGGDWRPAEPDDGLLDGLEESFSARLPKDLTSGPHIVNVRAWDSGDNVGSARIEVRIAK